MPKFKKLHLSILIISLVLLLAFVFVYIFLEDNVPTDTQLSSNSNITESFNQVITDDTSSGNLDDISQTSSDQSNDIQVSDDGVSSQFTPPVVEADGFTQEDIEQINKVIEKYGQNVSVFYKDIYSGNSYNYNQDNKYFIASLIKAPYAMYIYDLVSQGKCSLDDKFILTEEIKQQGTGKLKDMDADTELTLKEMLEYLIVNSDNTAMKMLLKKFPKQDYT
ncbi:MAG: serine hydrolase, partial [Oscillospiraceae bacterium]